MRRIESFTFEERKLLAEAIWRRQRCFIAGDKQFKEYGAMLNEILDGIDYIPGRIL